MQISSLRVRVLLVGILTASIVVGSLALTSFFVVTEAMHSVADQTTSQVSDAAATLVHSRAVIVRDDLAADGLRGRQLEAATRRALVAEVGELLRAGGFVQSDFAVYDGPRLLWSSGPAALDTDAAARRRAATTGESVQSDVFGSPFAGLSGKADLGKHVVHVPLPDIGEQGVLDVVYHPTKEESLIDSMRPTMFVLTMLSALLAVLMTQFSMSWVLRLVDDLRRASDAIGEGDLDVRLPDKGRNEVGDLARSINALIERLRRRSEAQTRFVADASHELATPVAGIRGYVNILREWGGEDPDVREESIRAVDRESRRMARLCGELLSMVRSEEPVQLIDVEYDLNAVTREALALAATNYLGKGIEFIGPEEGRLVLRGDPNKTEQLLGVLLDNAGKYTERGVVRVTNHREGDEAVIEVSDTGIGIPEKDLPSIFDRFYRSDSSRSRSSGGFGLGLSIARNIAEAAGGTIEAESVLGEGSTFIVRLPVRD